MRTNISNELFANVTKPREVDSSPHRLRLNKKDRRIMTIKSSRRRTPWGESPENKKKGLSTMTILLLVEAAGLEPTVSSTRNWRDTTFATPRKYRLKIQTEKLICARPCNAVLVCSWVHNIGIISQSNGFVNYISENKGNLFVEVNSQSKCNSSTRGCI